MTEVLCGRSGALLRATHPAPGGAHRVCIRPAGHPPELGHLVQELHGALMPEDVEQRMRARDHQRAVDLIPLMLTVMFELDEGHTIVGVP